MSSAVSYQVRFVIHDTPSSTPKANASVTPSTTYSVTEKEQEAEEFYQSIRDEVRTIKYFNQKNAGAWFETTLPYIFYGALPSIKKSFDAVENPIIKTIANVTITVIEAFPAVSRLFSPLFDHTQLENTPVESRGKFGSMVYDKNGFPIISENGSPQVVFSTNSLNDTAFSLFAFFSDSTKFLGFQAAVKTYAIYTATDDWKKATCFWFYEWRVRELEKLTEANRIPEAELSQEILDDPNYKSFLTGRVFVFPMKCNENHVHEWSEIERKLLGSCACYDGKPLRAEDLKPSIITYLKIKAARK